MSVNVLENTPETAVKYPGLPEAMDGTAAIVAMETAASEAAGAYPITPSTQMGEGWAAAAAEGRLNVNGRRLIFFEPEGEHAAAGVTAGMAMVGLRSANFSSGQGIAYMHESLYAAVGKRLTYVLNMACRAMTKHALNVHAGHDDYHAIDDTGFFQLFAKNAQEAADLNLVAHRVAELSLNPGICAQDGFLTSHVIESVRLPERELVREYLGDPSDIVPSPTPAQRLVFGETRRRIPEVFDLDNPTMVGVVQNQDSYAQGVASQRPFFFDHLPELTDQAMAELGALTGRYYRRAMGYRTDDAEYLVIGQGSVVWNAEAVADHLRESRGTRLGVVNLTMFRPFPADQLIELLRGTRGVLVMERIDQPLAVDPPLLREIRAAMAKGVENHRAAAAGRPRPHAGLDDLAPDDVPDCFSGCFGLGSRDLQAGDIVAAVENMLPDGKNRRHVYVGIDFVHDGPAPQAVADWQEKVTAAYPNVAELSVKGADEINLLPPGSLAVRIHSVGGWGAMTMGKNLTMTLFDLLGMQVKSNPKYGSEKKGQPTTFYAVFAHDPIRMNCELKHVDVVLSPDPNAFRHSNPLAGLADGGTFVIQSSLAADELWRSFPSWAREAIRRRRIRVFHLDAFAIAQAETDVADLQYRMQGAAFQGAFFKASPVMARENLDESPLFDAITAQLKKKFGHRGDQVVEDNLRVIRRGFDEVLELAYADLPDEATPAVAKGEVKAPWYHDRADHAAGLADPERFFGQICGLYREGADPIADPFAAFSAIPAATGVLRDMTDIRFEVPEFVADLCTGCGQCWTQCPDAAIPGLVSEIGALVSTGLRMSGNGGPSPAMSQLVEPLSAQLRQILRAPDAPGFGGALARAYTEVVPELGLEAEAREALDVEFDQLAGHLDAFPVAVTAPFFTVPERREEGSGGLLSVTINPYACKGCNLCVEVCPDGALRTVRQDDPTVEKLRHDWSLWQHLPDTPDRFVQVSDMEHGIGVLHTLLLKKDTFESMVGGDGSCMGCGEKTGVHLVVSAIEASLRPRVKVFVEKIDGLLSRLEAKIGQLLVVSTDLDDVSDGHLHVDVEVRAEDQERVGRLTRLVKELKELRWRYVTGPSGRGRASLGISNATGCSSVWGSTYPYNPYPYPWVNHLFQDAPSVAIGLFEGIMRKMADAFAAVRKAELEVENAYDAATHDPFFTAFDWRSFDDEEFLLCPPIVTIGGDGAMLDIGFQNVSRLMASGKPLRVLVLDTQVYSNTGGQACTSGFHAQISDMATYGAARHGKEENRKEMGLIAMAHRGVFVHQTSQALPSHLLGGVLRGLSSRRPAIFNVYSPCQAEHGLPDSGSATAAKLALESRAFPYFTYDPDQGRTMADRLELDGNPDLDATWPTYELTYLDDDDVEQELTLPLTIADWAGSEPRFARHFKNLPKAAPSDGLVLFHEYLELTAEEQDGKTPYILVTDEQGHLARRSVSHEIVELALERLDLWDELRELGGVKVPANVAKRLTSPLERKLREEIEALRAEYEAKLDEVKRTYPEIITRRIAQSLVAGGGLGAMSAPPATVAPSALPAAAPARPPAAPTAAAGPLEPAPSPEPAPAPEPAVSAEAGMDPYIDTELCTSCNECTNINPKMFKYDENNQAYIADAHAGTFKQIVQAAERCTARIIHPGTPVDPDEPGLDALVKRAAPFN